MSIRVKCDHCGAVLKVKDALAGTKGKCPECKQAILVPQLGEADDVDGADANAETRPVPVTASTTSVPVTPPNAPPPAKHKSPEPAAAKAKPKSGGDDFDVDAFLSDDTAPNAKASAGLAAPEPAKQEPVKDRFGRRQIVAPPPSPPKAGDSPASVSANNALGGAPAGGGAASANARDLMTKAMGDSRNAAATGLPGKRPPREIDWAATRKEFAKPALIALGAVAGCVVMYFVGQAMFGNRLPLPRLADVTGTVTLDGEPVPNVIVSLVPVQPMGVDTRGKPLQLRTAKGKTDNDGFYRVWYIEGAEGSGTRGAPVDTKVRIAVNPANPRDMGKIPAKYQHAQAANIMREVKAAGNEGKFDVPMSSKE